ncbi:thiamine phosphate synthase [uncultured Pseudokineococcus sp.]|uniref:thiamine phosphate synthase n=1 Tax=uncultured Pseudokineococcus sp. TaxID=1642928 RepID=UPI0026158215|nr:thiamine phosphate synthase [uncultured Pseudokineococcus sp.]
MSGGRRPWRALLREDPGAVLRTYLVTDTALCGGRGVVDVVRRAVAGGAGVVQVREKGGGGAERAELVRAVVAAVGGRALVLVDDDVELAVACGADGAHVGQGDLAPRRARRLLGAHAVLGLSAGTAGEVDAAAALREDDGAPVVDYLGLGPVWATPTKPEATAPLGLAVLADLAARSHAAGLPCVAIGGVDLVRAPSVRAAGVDGACAVSALCAAPDPEAAAAALDAPVPGGAAA